MLVWMLVTDNNGGIHKHIQQVERSKRKTTMSDGRASSGVALSVILPVYNAMPWLPISVRDMLKQVVFQPRHTVEGGSTCLLP